MTTAPTAEAEQTEPTGRPNNRWPVAHVAILILACLVAATAASAITIAISAGDRAPTEDSVEAGFARDMQVHHAQAVEMATIIRDRTDDPGIRTLAYDILTSQQQQMGQMFAWLRVWGLPQNSANKRMAWMSVETSEMTGMDHSSMPSDDNMTMALKPDGRMPGMASQAELTELRRVTGIQAERLFLKLMITHHKAGVAMAEAALKSSKNQQVDELAGAIVKSQKAEIKAMKQLLTDRLSGTAN